MARQIRLSARQNIMGGGINSLKTDMTAVKADLDVLKAKGAVKSVQRGVTEKSVAYADPAKVTIPISQVSIEKAILLYEITFTGGGGTRNVLGAILKESAIELTLDINIASSISAVWQVIEFY